VAIPVSTTRKFFHTGIVVRGGAGIERPEDLAGKRVGVPAWSLRGPCVGWCTVGRARRAVILETPHCTEVPHLSQVLYYHLVQSFQELPLACGDADRDSP
jgi:hypothetical protein